jgi:hypothetical protein
VALTRISTDVALRNDWLLRRLFARAARGLPLAELGEVRRPVSLEPERMPLEAERAVQGPERALRRSYGSSAT